jgi:imidazoleglycerol phosphate synthase glutamine amidotransferase subunit HisH
MAKAFTAVIHTINLAMESATIDGSQHQRDQERVDLAAALVIPGSGAINRRRRRLPGRF